jgi:hypothetical protein
MVRTKEDERERGRERERERKEEQGMRTTWKTKHTFRDGGHVAGTRETWSPQELATKCNCLFESVAIFFVASFSL